MLVGFGRIFVLVCVSLNLCWYVLVGKCLNFGVILSIIWDFSNENHFLINVWLVYKFIALLWIVWALCALNITLHMKLKTKKNIVISDRPKKQSSLLLLTLSWSRIYYIILANFNNTQFPINIIFWHKVSASFMISIFKNFYIWFGI